MHEQSRLQRLPHLNKNETQCHVVRVGQPVRIGSTSEDNVYAHKNHFNNGLNGHVSPVTESALRHFNLQNEKFPRHFSGLKSKDNYVNLPQAPKPPLDPLCKKDKSTSILGIRLDQTFPIEIGK